MRKNKEIIINVLNSEYKVGVAIGDRKFLKKTLLNWGYEDNSELENHLDTLSDRRGVTFRQKHCHPFIWLPSHPKTGNEIGTLAHEAFHAVDFIFLEIGETAMDEVFAHSIGAIVKGVLNDGKIVYERHQIVRKSK